MQCKHWDCGWCYAPDGSDTNDRNGACDKPEECQELANQEIARLKDLNARLVRQCAELQTDNAEMKRAHKSAFEVLRQTELRRPA